MQDMQETWVSPQGQDDPLEEEMATHPSEIPDMAPLSFSSLLLPFPWSPFPAFTYPPYPNLSNSLLLSLNLDPGMSL